MVFDYMGLKVQIKKKKKTKWLIFEYVLSSILEKNMSDAVNFIKCCKVMGRGIFPQNEFFINIILKKKSGPYSTSLKMFLIVFILHPVNL